METRLEASGRPSGDNPKLESLAHASERKKGVNIPGVSIPKG